MYLRLRDHPLFGISDPQQLKRRAGIVEIRNCGAYISDISYKGNQVIGEIQTLSGFQGPSLANLITKDKIDIGFSLRALGSVEPLTDGTLDVKMPLRAITYDVVSNPSHANSRIQEFLPESFIYESADDSNMGVLAESGDLSLLEQQDNIIIDNTNGNHYIQAFTDDLINETFLNIINKGLRFKI